MPSVAFATYRDAPAMTDDDRLASVSLRRLGIEVDAAAWDADDVEWNRFDLVVIRSTWNYHLEPERYGRWIRSFLSRSGRLWNPPGIVLGTIDKRYLMALAREGVDVVPTAYARAGDGEPLRAILERHGWDEVVVKPAISASARGTWRSSRATAEPDQARFAAQRLARDVLVQPYCPEIASRGEWSLIFFDGPYSHAVLKTPAPGDFRVQRHFGGSSVAAAPGPRLVDQASAVLPKLGGPLLYARVDGIERDGRFLVMEVEVNEPHLFLSFSEDAPARFAAAIARKLPGSVR